MKENIIENLVKRIKNEIKINHLLLNSNNHHYSSSFQAVPSGLYFDREELRESKSF